nr:hypothetical protein CFP56_26088 [Quercus suber]
MCCAELHYYSSTIVELRRSGPAGAATVVVDEHGVAPRIDVIEHELIRCIFYAPAAPATWRSQKRSARILDLQKRQKWKSA